MSYFLTLQKLTKRSQPAKINSNFFLFQVGDVIAVMFTKSGYYFLFEGLCLSKKKKQFYSPDSAFTLCNTLSGVLVELSVSYYQHLTFILRTINSKAFYVRTRRSKLHYLRNHLTKGGRVF